MLSTCEEHGGDSDDVLLKKEWSNGKQNDMMISFTRTRDHMFDVLVRSTIEAGTTIEFNNDPNVSLVESHVWLELEQTHAHQH